MRTGCNIGTVLRCSSWTNDVRRPVTWSVVVIFRAAMQAITSKHIAAKLYVLCQGKSSGKPLTDLHTLNETHLYHAEPSCGIRWAAAPRRLISFCISIPLFLMFVSSIDAHLPAANEDDDLPWSPMDIAE